MDADPLPSWNQEASKAAIIEFVDTVCGRNGSQAVPVEERVAVFDNDGTLWCEKPMPIQLDFFLKRWVEMANAQPELLEQQPWKAAIEADYAWFGSAIDEHYVGNDTKVKMLTGGILRSFAGISVDEFEGLAERFLRTAQHPSLGRSYLECAYTPMVELLGYLADNGFTNYVASGGGRDFMRPVTEELYGVPREQVIGSTISLSFLDDRPGGVVVRKPEADYLGDGPEKPIRIWSRAGRRPLLAAGNSNGDIPMLEFTHHETRPTLRLLINHDDGEREFAYTAGAESALERAGIDGWIVVSVKDDWARVFDS